MINIMPRIKIIITGGNVHNVGYRVMFLNRALEIGTDYFNTFNTSRKGLQAVIALIEGDEEQLNEFMNFVQTKRPEKAVVSGITDEEYSRTVPPIERCLQSFQMEQWGKGIPILLEIRDVLHCVKEDTGKMLEKQDSMLEKQDSMLEKQDMMLEKQDSMLEKQDSMLEKQDSMLEKQDMMLEKQDSMLEKQDSMLEKQDDLKSVIVRGFKELKEEHIKTREMSMEIFRSEVQVLREEIDSLRSSVEEIKRKVGIA